MDGQNSIFDRVISKSRPIIFVLEIITVFVIFLLMALYLDGNLDKLTEDFSWRGLLIPPTIIVYILTIAPIMSRMETQVLNSFQAIFVDDSEYYKIIKNKTTIKPIWELTAIGIGFFIGVISAFGSIDGGFSWVSLYWLVTTTMMFVLLIWTIFVSINGSRVISTLLHQPMLVDPFNTTPFEPIGRQSLMIAVVFIGGITLSLIFIGMDLSILKQPMFWLVYTPLVMVPIVLFFLNMTPTHKVLADTKRLELATVRNQLQESCRKLLDQMEYNEETTNLPGMISALSIYEKLLKETPTWPYNTAMLRTLFFSVLIPLGTLIGRIIVQALAN